MNYINERSNPILISKYNSQDNYHENYKKLSLTQNFIDPNKMSPPNSFIDKLMKRIDNYYSESNNQNTNNENMIQ